ncbi:hypothetical protein GVN16_15940 [Emticicia sp. CRIBPO]|uniref:hypothetical protein n=1 Tax=Emticicia sp. CRIBPO TaxID=2683258 RepID=UPI0014121164|nr:hypothetical protein [Emticicia sp. CRIBPO]NBA87265.1 hypothetical protein [Emticicia sp. CRIBPO]
MAGATSKTLSASKPGEYRAVLTLKSNAATIYEAVVNLAGAPCKIYELDLSCQVPNNITLPNAVAAGVQLAAGDEFTAGDYTVVVTEIISGSPAGWKGKGYIKMKLVAGIVLKQVSVNFENAVVNECYELASGSVVTDYDPTWGNILDVDDVFSILDNYVDLQAELNDFLQIFSGSPEDVAKLNEYKAKFHDLNSLIQNNGDLDAQTKSGFQGEVDGLDDYIECAGDDNQGLNLRRAAFPGICTFNPWTALAKCLGSAAIDVFLQYTCKWIELVVDGKPKNFTDFNGISAAMKWDETLASATMSCAFSLIPIPNNKAAAVLVGVGAAEGAALGFTNNVIAQYNTLKNQYPIDQIIKNIQFRPALQPAAVEGMIQVITMVVTRRVSESPKVQSFFKTLQTKANTNGMASVRKLLKNAGLDDDTIDLLLKKLGIGDRFYHKQKDLLREWKGKIDDTKSTSIQKGNFGEIASDAYLQDLGFQPLHSRIQDINKSTRQG